MTENTQPTRELPSPLAAALAAVQKELPTIRKDETGRVSGTTAAGKQYNYTYKYADLSDLTEAMMPILGKHGLAFTSAPRFVNGIYMLICELIHESGESKTADWPLPDPTKAGPQQIGSAMTYGRRYCLGAMTGVAPAGDDDDAAAAQQQYAQQQYEREQYQQEQPPAREPTEKEKAAAELRAAVQQHGLDESLVPSEFQRRYGKPIQSGTPDEVRDYTAFVTRTGTLGDDPWQTGTPDAGEESQDADPVAIGPGGASDEDPADAAQPGDPDESAQRDTQAAREETAGMPSQQEHGS